MWCRVSPKIQSIITSGLWFVVASLASASLPVYYLQIFEFNLDSWTASNKILSCQPQNSTISTLQLQLSCHQNDQLVGHIRIIGGGL